MTLDPNMPADEQLEIIRNLKGVKYAFYLDDEILESVRKEEMTVRGTGNIPVDNQGFYQALHRDRVICLIKKEFRHPPEPTVILVDGEGKRLGEEVFPWTRDQYKDRTDIVWLFDSFVLFPDVKGTKGQFFVMPPVSFPELNESNGCKDVISCSPAPTCDKMIREYAGLKDDTQFASILVAFNRA